MRSMKMVLLVAALMLSGSIFAEEGSEKGEKRGACGKRGGFQRGHHGRGNRAGMICKFLGLTEEQIEQAKEIREANAEKMKKLAEAMREAQKAIREASHADDIDEAAIRDLASNAADAMAEMAILRAEMKQSFQAILTDEQKAKIEEKKAEMKERFEKMKERFKERRERYARDKKKEGDE